MTTATNLLDAAINVEVPRPPAKSGMFADLEALKVSLKEAGIQGASEVLTTIELRKPRRNEFVRVHPGEQMTIALYTYEDTEEKGREYYAIMPNMIAEMSAYQGADLTQLYTAVSRQGVTIIWPLKIPTAGAASPWQKTALEAAEQAKTRWTRVCADMSRQYYRIYCAESELGEPEFPERPFGELLDIAFAGRVIDSIDHPIYRKIRGRV